MSLTIKPGAIDPPPWRPAVHQAAQWLRSAPRAAILELMARCGFLARGVLYVSFGTLALLAANGRAPRAGGPIESMAAWGQWPAGLLLIWLTAFGLLAFSAWRWLQVILDADAHGRSPKGIMVRIGQAVSGVAHFILAWSLFGLVKGLKLLHRTDHKDSAQSMAAMVLDLRHGDVMLIVAGAIIVAFGAGSIGQGLFQPFAKRLGCSDALCPWAVALARIGYVGRGLAFVPSGFFMADAGFHASASNAHDFGGALIVMHHQPFGGAVLTGAACGLIAFGVFAFFEAAFRRIVVPLKGRGAPL
jgi:hypothetical protein